MQVFLFVIAILLFTGLVLIHEFGHFIVAKRNGVDVEEFGLGFPPRAWSKKLKSGLLLSLNWLPIGGFVKLKGEHDGDQRRGSFGAASLGAKTKILLAGVGMNLIAALVLLTFLALVGMPKLITADQFGQDQYSVKGDTRVSKQEVLIIYVEPNSPASRAGLSDLDNIVSVSHAGQVIAVHTPDDLKKATQAFAGQRVQVNYIHQGQRLSKSIQLRTAAEVQPTLDTDQQKGYLGVEPYELAYLRSTWSAPITAVGLSGQLTWLTLKGVGHAFAGLGSLIAGATTGNHQARINGQDQATSQVGGPVAIFKVLWTTGSIGYQFMIAIIAIISLTLAIMNVLPIPALDGGRLFMILVSRLLLRRPLSKVAEERWVASGMVLIMTLVVLITIVDVKRFL